MWASVLRFAALAPLRTHNPVSYTHLDVYKRQPQYSETVYEADGAVSTTLYGTGRKMVRVYFDGVLDQKQSYERSFGSVSYTHLGGLSAGPSHECLIGGTPCLTTVITAVTAIF